MGGGRVDEEPLRALWPTPQGKVQHLQTGDITPADEARGSKSKLHASILWQLTGL